MSVTELHAKRDEFVMQIQNIEAQFSRRKADLSALRDECFRSGDKQTWFSAEREYLEWKGRAASAKRFLVDQLQSVKAEIHEHFQLDSGNERHTLWELLRPMVRAEIEDVLASRDADFSMEVDDFDVEELQQQILEILKTRNAR